MYHSAFQAFDIVNFHCVALFSILSIFFVSSFGFTFCSYTSRIISSKNISSSTILLPSLLIICDWSTDGWVDLGCCLIRFQNYQIVKLRVGFFWISALVFQVDFFYQDPSNSGIRRKLLTRRAKRFWHNRMSLSPTLYYASPDTPDVVYFKSY